MKKKFVQLAILEMATLFLLASHSTFGQQAAQKPEPTRSAVEAQRVDVQALNQTIEHLNTRIEVLADELESFKTDLKLIMSLWQLTAYEQRQMLWEEKLTEAQTEIRNLETRETSIRNRLRTLDKEYIYTGSAFITQQEARRQIRSQLQRESEELAARHPQLTAQEKQLEDQLNRIKSKLSKINKELETLQRQPEAEAPDRGVTEEPR